MLLVLAFLGMNAVAMAQTEIPVRGVVRSDSAELEAVTVSLKSDPKKTVKTDEKGRYSLKAPGNGTLVFTYVGYKTLELEINGNNVLNVTLKQADNSLNDVAIVAYGTQKKTSMVSSITTINPKELKGPTSNLTTMLAGRIAGMIAYQRSGEPGADNASFFIRGITTFGSGKVTPLILIDGIESSTDDLARLQPDDIAAFSVLKDATAAALYGARGANGVMLVKTKMGQEGKATFGVRFENSQSTNTRNFKFADNITYMNLANEAYMMRHDDPKDIYSQSKIQHTINGDDPYMYPNVNWLKQLIKDNTNNQRLNVNVSGGGKTASYYVAGTYNVDNGVINVDKLNNFNSNIKLKNYSLRSNVTLNLTPTTQLIVRTYGQFDDYNGPLGGGAALFSKALGANPVKFAPIYPQSYAPELKHPLFGNASTSETGVGSPDYDNPYADAVSGYQQYNTSNLLAHVEINQDLRFWLPGLSVRGMAYTQRYSYFDLGRWYNPFYYSLGYASGTTDPVLTPLNASGGTDYLMYGEGTKSLSTTNHLEMAANYSKLFNGVHSVSGMVIGIFQSSLNANAGSLQLSLPHRNEGVSGRFSYGYDNRYIAEFDFGYNGSERFAENHRFGFFPSAGFAWNIQNEKFFEDMKGTVNVFKIRGTYGLVGNDQIGSDDDRFFYLSNVTIGDGNRNKVYFGQNYDQGQSLVTVSRYENPNISWEKSYKTNLGLEIGLWNKLNLQVDVYHERRTNILFDRDNIPSTMGLATSIKANAGKAEGRGVDVTAEYNKSFNKSTYIQLRGTFTYAASKLTEKEEPKYAEAHRSRLGYSLSQNWGLIGERLFVDDAEPKNSPAQWDARAGDIKYRDMNGDGVIQGDADQVPIGYPTTPEITYGFGFSVGYKNFEFSAFFQGNARSSIFISNSDIQPFYSHDNYQNGLLKAIADDHWSPDNQNIYAFWPRMSDYVVTNNQWTSTWWMRNGAYLRMKNVELAYNLPPHALHMAGLRGCRIYLNASNLFVISGFKMWDPEMGGNGLGYPQQRVVNVGISVNF